MSELRKGKVIKYILDVLGGVSKHFIVQHHDTLVDEGDYFSMLVSVQPKPDEIDGVIISGSPAIIEITIDDTGLHQMIFGEDSEFDITLLNLYRFMYWSEIGKDADSVNEITRLTQETKQLRHDIERLQSTSSDLATENEQLRDEVIEECAAACESEYLQDGCDTAGDIAYNNGVRDVEDSIRKLKGGNDGKPNTGMP